MENASRALLMAASVLISIMVISLGTYLFSIFGNYTKQINANLSAKQKEEFNAQFTKFEDGELCTVYDIVTVINLTKNSNNQYEEYVNKIARTAEDKKDSNTYIYVDILKDSNENQNINELSSEIDLNDFINKNNQTINYGEKIVYNNLYKCSVEISNQTGFVKHITFTKNK